MRVYVAARLEQKNQVRRAYKRLEAAGHTITHKWTDAEDFFLQGRQAVLKNKKMAGDIAKKDINGVLAADAIIVLTSNKKRFKGALIELGAALAANKKVYLVGPLNDITPFYFHPNCKQFKTLKAALEEFEKEEKIKKANEARMKARGW